MEPQARATPDVETASCPFFHPIDATGRYHRLGSCTGLPHGLLMIPTVEECRALCGTPAHVLCPVYRSRLGQHSLDPWLQAEHDPWALRPLDWPCAAVPLPPLSGPLVDPESDPR